MQNHKNKKYYSKSSRKLYTESQKNIPAPGSRIIKFNVREDDIWGS